MAVISMDLKGIITPTLLVDEQKVRRNIRRLVKKSKNLGFELVPHFKTHQSLKIGQWFHEETIETITVSSVSMAQYFAKSNKNRWKSIYIAFPVNILDIETLNKLAKEVKLTVLINESEQAGALVSSVANPVRVKIEVDCGSARSGVDPGDAGKIKQLAERITNSQHKLDGLYSHFGHTYKAESPQQVKEIFGKSLQILKKVRDDVFDGNIAISTGDTPSASVVEDFKDIYSLHAGNFVFYDLTQSQIGVCHEDDIAIALAAPIVSKNNDRLELIVHGGGIHLSKESMYSRELGVTIFGKVVILQEDGWSNSLRGCYVKSVSQEHGVIRVTKEIFDSLNIGDVIGILPVHSCMTADVMRGYLDLRDNKIDHFKGLAY